MIDPFAPRAPQTIAPEPDRVYVLCEGPDDAAMVRGIAQDEGFDLLAVTVSPRLDSAGEVKAFADNAARARPRALGIVRDKETDGLAEEQKVRDWLANAGLRLPGGVGAIVRPAVEGTDLRLGYFLNPEGADAGAIEQMFVDQIPGDLSACIETFVGCVESTGLWSTRQSPAVLKDKVRLRAYLAARQGGTNTSLNAGLVKHHLSVATPAFEGLRDFLRRLCQ